MKSRLLLAGGFFIKFDSMQATRFLQLFAPSLIWKIKTSEKKIFLTFDDGPVPDVTPWVLETLSKYNIKATFFCVGENVRRHTEIYSAIINAGHSTGNHTMNHLNGWQNTNENYFKNIKECSVYVNSALFRPPYGRIKFSQVSALKKEYRIIMWDVLSRDYDQSLGGKDCSDLVIKNSSPGSIVVFHDSLKAEKRLKEALPVVIEHFLKKGYSFEVLQMN
jgi:peptidoglycan-N-acetylglucosamine deacetylase